MVPCFAVNLEGRVKSLERWLNGQGEESRTQVVALLGTLARVSDAFAAEQG